MTSISSNFYASLFSPVAKTPAQRPAEVGPNSDDVEKANGSSPSDGAQQKPFSQVILDVRSTLDAGYQKLGKIGDEKTTYSEWNTIGLRDLDRRSLFAVANNAGGLFSSAEVSAAQSEWTNRVNAAETAVDPSRRDTTAIYKAAIDFYDGASPEEKSSLAWAQARAGAQAGYEQITKQTGSVAEDVDTHSPVVNMFVKAFSELAETGDPTQKVGNMPSWQRALDLWHLQNDEAKQISWVI